MQMAAAGNSINPLEWPTYLQDEFIQRVANAKGFEEAEVAFEEIMEKGLCGSE